MLARHLPSEPAALRWVRGVDLGATGYLLALLFASLWGAWTLRSRLSDRAAARG
ncbi:MAG: hypothetical protein U0324_02665 [Polyangiales bacterium]